MRCPKCDKTISQKDHFCRYCGQVITAETIYASHLREDEQHHSLLAQGIIARCEPPSGTWGAHIYKSAATDSYPRSRPKGCPEWVEAPDWRRWFHEGLVVWDNLNHRIGAINSSEAVRLIETVLSHQEWKVTGIPVIERTTRLSLEPVSRSKNPKKPVAPPEPSAEKSRRQEIHEDERLRLTNEAAEEFYIFLRTHEAILRKMMADHEQRAQEALGQVWDRLIQLQIEQEVKTIKLTDYTFPWQRRETGEFVAEVPPNRATIKLQAHGLGWQPIIERPGRFKSDYNHFVSLAKAMHWVEAEIPRLQAEDEALDQKRDQAAAEDQARVAALPTPDLTLYWIAPAALEPEQITYRIYIDLEYGPAKSKQYEISFGEFLEFETEYYTATQLAHEIRLNPAQLDIQQLAPEFGIYHIFSRAAYHDAPLAAAEAQQVWSQSAIAEKFAEKKILRARYGYQEIETEYCVWLGRLEQTPWEPWARQKSRAEFLRDQAMDETLSAALEVNGYRKYFQVGYRSLSDEALLWKLHYHRTQSKFIPPQLRAESWLWLRDHPKEALNQETDTQVKHK